MNILTEMIRLENDAPYSIIVIIVLLLLLMFSLYRLFSYRWQYQSMAWRLEQTQQQYEQALNTQHELTQELKALDAQKDHLDRLLAKSLAQVSYLQQRFEDERLSLDQIQQRFSQQFELLSQRIFTEKEQRLEQQNQASLNQLLEPLRVRLDSFAQRVNEVHQQSVEGNAVLSTQIQQVMQMGLTMGEQAQSLSRALKGDKKTLGNWGEMQLALALQQAGLIEDKHYQLQKSYRNQSGQLYIPDAVIFLPEQKHLIVDSKVSLVDYQQAVNASNHEQAQHFLARHFKAVKNHIDELAGKDYSQLPTLDSPGFVFMFMPIEAAFIEVLQSPMALFQYAYQKNVVLVSPTTLMPMLKTIAMLWMLENSSQQALELGNKAMDVYNQVARLGEQLSKLGQHLTSTNQQFNQTIKAFSGQQGLVSKVDKFNRLSAKSMKDMPDPLPLD